MTQMTQLYPRTDRPAVSHEGTMSYPSDLSSQESSDTPQPDCQRMRDDAQSAKRDVSRSSLMKQSSDETWKRVISIVVCTGEVDLCTCVTGCAYIGDQATGGTVVRALARRAGACLGLPASQPGRLLICMAYVL